VQHAERTGNVAGIMGTWVLLILIRGAANVLTPWRTTAGATKVVRRQITAPIRLINAAMIAGSKRRQRALEQEVREVRKDGFIGIIPSAAGFRGRSARGAAVV
jgi:hypothetical protein